MEPLLCRMLLSSVSQQLLAQRHFFLLKLPHGYPVLVHALGVKFAPVEFHVTFVSVLLVCQLKNPT